MKPDRAWACALAAVAALHLLTLHRYPYPFTDEAWFAARATAYAQTGCAFGPLDRGVFDRLPSRCTLFPFLPTWVQSFGVRLAPDPLTGVRVVSLLSGVMLLVAVGAVAGRVCGPAARWIAALVTGTSQAFVYSAHLGRYDALGAALGWGGVALALRRGRAAEVFAGLAAGLAVEVHGNGAVFPPLVLIGLAATRGRRGLLGASARVVAGVALGAVFYLAVHVVPDRASFLAFNRLAFATTHVPPLATLDAGIMLQGLRDQLEALARLYLIPLPLVVAAPVFALRRRRREDRVLLALCLGAVIACGLLIRNKLVYYALLGSPAVDLLIVAALSRLFAPEEPGRPRLARPVREFALALAVAAAVFALAPLGANGTARFRDVAARVAAAVRPHDRVMGSQLFWFALADRDYLSWEGLVYHRRAVPGATLDDAFRTFRPDVLVLDRQLSAFVLDPWEVDDAYHENLRIPRRELERFLDRHGELLEDFDGQPYGRIRVFRIRWDGS